MYDYFKLNISYLDFEKLRNNPLLNWSALVDTKTGEIVPMFSDWYKSRKYRPEEVAFYNGLYFERYNIRNEKGERVYSKTFVCGSLHKFDNDGLHNADRYTLKRHTKVLDRLNSMFGIIPSKTKIHHIEVCTLLSNLDYHSKDIIENILIHLVRGGKPKQYHISEFPTSSLFKVASRNQYQLKAYWKSLQYLLEDDLFRFEVKIFTMERLNKKGFYYLSQTIEPKYIDLLQKELIQRWNETLIYDWTINSSELTKKEKIKIKDYCNPKYWIKLSSTKRHEELMKYKTMVHNFSENVHSYIAQQIALSLNNLTISPKEPETNNLSNSIVSTTMISQRRYPEYIYQYSPNHPKRKKLRNDQSNFIRTYSNKVDKLLKLDRPDLIDKIPINPTQKEYLHKYSTSDKWQWLISILQKQSII